MGFNPDILNRQTRKEHAEAIVLEIIRQSGGRFVGKTRLYKAFYFAHLYYFKDEDGLLSEWPIVKMGQGPGIDCGKEILEQLKSSGLISVDHQKNGPYLEEVYELRSNEESHLGLPEIQAIKKACEFLKGYPPGQAGALSALTHDHSRSWRQAPSLGDELNIYIDIVGEDEDYELRRERADKIRNQLETAFGR